ncbi:triphosphoribosyl-dephospho-CoA synthase [Xenorhabdus bovienii]|uniref:triphosphoribosyl-dephospho-CoA synthase n=1 Tax=Xenorhabdus bovienii TaxID=40576 RepID=UPI0023B2209F|nr:triphosphoribosyl-dephospho-CoA synthase [Xenorhabdus bovienii]MDE9453244.1 triphosphoribosyl-dephospho-CoA synthase [Xenorhabdus bovienii]
MNNQISSMTEIIEKFVAVSETSLLMELNAHPKPGLITPFSNGSHSDMNYHTMLSSIRSISNSFSCLPYDFFSFIELKDYDTSAKIIRDFGINVEKNMLKATGGINTHKGAIFLLLVLLAGCLIAPFSWSHALKASGAFAKFLPQYKFELYEYEATTGNMAKKCFGLGGIKEEVSFCFPTISSNILSFINEWDLMDKNLCVVMNLIRNMSIAEDTTLLNRNFDLSLLYLIQEKSREVIIEINNNISCFYDSIQRLNFFCSELNVSPGGSADLTIATIFTSLWFGEIDAL